MNQPLEKLLILAVDDNRTNLHILQVFLKKLGHDVILAENGEDAVQKFEAQKPHMVLLDIMMPVMDGFEAARQIKARTLGRWVPIIFLSALNRDENLLEGLEAGGDDYLTKPINFIVLEAKIRSMHRSLILQTEAIESAKRLQAISDAVLESIITIDTRGTITACNHATEIIFGWQPEEMIGKNVKMLMPDPHHSAHDGYLKAYLEGGPAKIIGKEREVTALRKDGCEFPAELALSELRLDSSRMFIGVLRDISERKYAERKLRENAEELQEYFDRTESEQQLAIKLVEKQLHRRGLQDSRLRYRVIPAQHFSGDVVAASRSVSGSLYGLLADATGHGLAAAISVLPMLSVFYRMVANDASVEELVRELNMQLRESVPLGRFVAATVLRLDETRQQGEIWVGGTPEALLFDASGKLTTRFVSSQLPLGIVDNKELGATPENFSWSPNSQLVLFSDGLIEAEDSQGNQFGLDGLIEGFGHHTPRERFDAVQSALAAHLGTAVASDDVSLMVIDCP